MKYQIYKITNLLEPQWVYIGMTSKPLKERFRRHCQTKKSAIYEPIQHIGKEHFEIIPIDHAHDKETAFCKEEFWTLFYEKQGYNLYNRNYGSRNSEQTRNKLSEALKRVLRSYETRKKMSEAKNKNKKRVQCIETETIYPSLHEAQRQTNICRSNIRRVCKNQNETAGGYHWKYVI